MSVDRDRALSALRSIPAGCDRQRWATIGMAAKAAGLTEDDFIAWSRSGENFGGERDCKLAWKSFRPEDVTEATLFRAALDAGWQDPARTNGHNGHARAAERPQEKRRTTAEGKRPAFDFARLWDESEPATMEHPYIARKLGLPFGLRVYRGDRKIAGERIDGALLVPAYDAAGALQTWQAITASGKKLNAPGRPVAGWFRLDGNGSTIYVCEGIGQAWSAHQATGCAAVSAFGVGNLLKVAKALQGDLVLVADVGKETAIAALAAELRCRWVAPPADLGDNGDLNDLHQRDGLQAVADLLAQPQAPATETDATDALRPVGFKAFTAALTPPTYAVDGLFIRGYCYAWTGPSGHGKTAIALTLTFCKGMGRPFAGYDTGGERVLYVAGENPDDVRMRASALAAELELSADELDEQIQFIDRSFTIAGRHGELIEIIEDGNFGMVVLDTDQALSSDADENDNRERVEHAKRVRALTRAAPRPTVIDLCHPPVNAGRNALRPRGGSSFLAEVDGNAGVWMDDGDTRAELFRTAKFRGPVFDPLVFDIKVVEVIRDASGRPMTAAIALPAAEEDAGDEAARGRRLTLLADISRHPGASLRERCRRLHLAQTTAHRDLRYLEGKGAISEGVEGHQITPKGKKWLAAN